MKTQHIETIEEFLKRGGQIKKGETPEYRGSGYSRYRMHEVSDNKPERIPGWFANVKKRTAK